MKTSTKLPRRVGTSLVRSMRSMCQKLETVRDRGTGLGYSKVSQERSLGSANFLPTDKAMFENILTFWTELRNAATNSRVPDGAFITVAKSRERRVKYAATPTSVGLVVTTGALERLLTLSTSVVTAVNYKDNKEVDSFACDQAEQYSRYSTHSPDFLRIADVLRYFQESDIGLMEISLNGAQGDFKKYESFYDSYNYYSNNNEEAIERRMYPMLCDRYQPETWHHHCTTLYSNIVKANKINPLRTPMTRPVALAELSLLKAGK